MTKTRLTAGLLALAAMAHAPAAMAQECISEKEVSSLAIYVTPLVIDSVRDKCAGTLSASGFLATKGNDFRARYAALGDDTWPSAKSALFKFMGKKAGSGSNDIAQFKDLPDNVTRPLVDAIFTQKIGEDLKVKDCSKFERGMKLISPLEPRDTGALLAFIAAMAGVKNPAICSEDS
ncbi:MAG: hypothetical protein IE933_12935 [Sphingomonadales bacterium]|nr:hypothetical protein [Sphingomonadales bacterium]MBD3772177.1 hypothetical protein [Paracoccaceae bacterium]